MTLTRSLAVVLHSKIIGAIPYFPELGLEDESNHPIEEKSFI
ncbi:hypothetical protein BH10CYA1_BH10CYA1_34940 [soil metagenome]